MISTAISRRLAAIPRRLSCFASSWPVGAALRRAGVANARSIHTFTSRAELETLYRLARACPPQAAVLEIGSYLGASTCFIAAALKPTRGTLYCVDTWENQTMPDGLHDTFQLFSQNTQGVASSLRLLRKRSEDLTAADLATTFNLAFIDGDHCYAAVKSDFQRISPSIADGGVIAFHDTRYYQGVSQVLGEALASGTWILEGCVENLSWIRRGIFANAATRES